MSRMREHWSI